MSQNHERIEIPTELPWDPPGSDLRERLKAAYEDCGENCPRAYYPENGERDSADHEATTALSNLNGNVAGSDQVNIPGLRDAIRDAFIEHRDDWRLSGGGRMDYCFEGDPSCAEEYAIVALRALWKFGPRVLTET